MSEIATSHRRDCVYNHKHYKYDPSKTRRSHAIYHQYTEDYCCVSEDGEEFWVTVTTNWRPLDWPEDDS